MVKHIVIIIMLFILVPVFTRKLGQILCNYKVYNHILERSFLSLFVYSRISVYDIREVRIIGKNGWYPSKFSTGDSLLIRTDNVFISLINGKNIILEPKNPKKFIELLINENHNIKTQ